jgi:hypothetical protein
VAVWKPIGPLRVAMAVESWSYSGPWSPVARMEWFSSTQRSPRIWRQ